MQALVSTDGRAVGLHQEVPVAPATAWPAIIGGAFAAIALTLMLFALGSGFCLASVSPWSGLGMNAGTFTITTAVWLIVVQWLSAGLGGYLTGRLRTAWTDMHADEVFFRDTANGFLAWAVASVIGAAMLASVATSVIGAGADMAVGTAAIIGQSTNRATEQSAGVGDPTGYFVDSLFRSDRPSASASVADVRAETTRILLTGVGNDGVGPADKVYLAQLVAARTGLSSADAVKRVDEVLGKAKVAEVKLRQAADTARKAGAYLAVFTGLSMLIGAFIACAAAALGGQHRDSDTSRRKD
jgi:hypothetical protein